MSKNKTAETDASTIENNNHEALMDEMFESDNEASSDSMAAAKRIGLFGGTFNPLHLAHINAITTVQTRMNLDEIFVIPASQNPRKNSIEGASDTQRMEMLEVGLSEFPFVTIDDQELKRGGASYSVETIRSYAANYPAENIYLIIGADQFEEFDKWNEFDKILELVNLVVVTRPQHVLPFSESDLAEGLKPLVEVFDRQYIALKSGRSIEFIRLQDLDIASMDVRKRLRGGLNVDRLLSMEIEDYIRSNGMYAPIGPKIGDFETFTNFCAQALFARKGLLIRGYDLSQTESSSSSYVLIASGTSTRHASSLAESVMAAVKGEFGVLPQAVEGLSEGRWSVLDYGGVIVHVFYDFVRQEYRLEDLWKKGRDMQIVEAPLKTTESVTK